LKEEGTARGLSAMVEWSQVESGNKILSMNNECGSIAKTANQR